MIQSFCSVTMMKITGPTEKKIYIWIRWLACSSLEPSSGKVEAALDKNTYGVQHELRTIPEDSELNTVPVWCFYYQYTFKMSWSVISRNLSPSLCWKHFWRSHSKLWKWTKRNIILPINRAYNFFCCWDFKIQLDEQEKDPVDITLNTSGLIKCEWCNVWKLPVVFLQIVPAV